jgi:hypothetical protein
MPKKFDVREFEAFCRSKGDERYDYSLKHHCACAQFLRHGLGITSALVLPGYWRDEHGGAKHDLPKGVEEAVFAPPRTFSALADRLSRVDS